MDLSELQRKLIAAARADAPGDAVPYAFEKRILARLADRVVLDPWGPWARGLSRAAVLCVVAMLLLAAGSYFVPAATPENLSQDVETTLFAAVDNSSVDGPAEAQ
jgi:hypothetical protein